MYGKQKETRRFQQKTADFVELLPKFELETSSLPILPKLSSPVALCFVLAPGAVALQRLRAFSSLALVSLVVCSCCRIFGARMGFVWVSTQTSILNFSLL